MVKKGIPEEVLEELDIHKKEIKKPIKVNVMVENFQARIPIPKKMRLHMNLKKGSTCKMTYNKEKKELICKF